MENKKELKNEAWDLYEKLEEDYYKEYQEKKEVAYNNYLKKVGEIKK